MLSKIVPLCKVGASLQRTALMCGMVHTAYANSTCPAAVQQSSLLQSTQLLLAPKRTPTAVPTRRRPDGAVARGRTKSSSVTTRGRSKSKSVTARGHSKVTSTPARATQRKKNKGTTTRPPSKKATPVSRRPHAKEPSTRNQIVGNRSEVCLDLPSAEGEPLI